MSHTGWNDNGIDGSLAMESFNETALKGIMAEAFETGRSLIANDLGDDPLLGG